MKRGLQFSFFITLLLSWHAAQGDEAIAVIVNKDNQITELSNRQLIDLYMGKLVAFPDGNPAVPLDQPDESAVRKDFYKRLTGRSIHQINAYWSRIKFSGLGIPPQKYPLENILKQVSEVDNAIGYVKLSDVNDNVKVIYKLVQ